MIILGFVLLVMNKKLRLALNPSIKRTIPHKICVKIPFASLGLFPKPSITPTNHVILQREPSVNPVPPSMCQQLMTTWFSPALPFILALLPFMYGEWHYTRHFNIIMVWEAKHCDESARHCDHVRHDGFWQSGVDEGTIVRSVKPLVPTCDSLTTLATQALRTVWQASKEKGCFEAQQSAIQEKLHKVDCETITKAVPSE